MRTWVTGVLTLALLGSVGSAHADDGDVGQCGPSEEFLSVTEHLRAISMDLRGHPPTLQEYASVKAAGAVPDALILGMMETPQFVKQIVILHKELIWPYIANANWYDFAFSQEWSTRIHHRKGQWPLVYGRGGQGVFCRDEEEPDLDNIQMVVNPDGTQQEGWTCVTPYFHVHPDPWIASLGDCPSGQVKLCAHAAKDAQFGDNGLPCEPKFGEYDPGCGCGPNLEYCGQYQQFHSHMLQSLNKAIEWMVVNDRPYHELLSDAPLFVNGPLALYYRHFAFDSPVPVPLIPDLDYVQDVNTWVPLTMGADWSGVLTHPVFRVRFMTNRSRADRYYNSFLCSPFEPPVGGLPPATDAAMLEPDLQKRPGCKFCHSTLEPVGAYWGHWAEYTPRYLNGKDYPDYDPFCHECALAGVCDPRCLQQYVTSTNIGATLPYVGWLNSYLFMDEEDVDNIEEGPSLLVQRTLLDGRLPECTVRNFASIVMGRALLPDEESWLEEIESLFVDSNHDLKILLHALVTSDFYRRVP